MRLHYSDPSKQRRECVRCRGEGVETVSPPTRTRLAIRDTCPHCHGSGRLGDPDAKPDVEVERGRDGRYAAYRDAGSSINRRHRLIGVYHTEAAALAAARTAIGGER